MLINNLKRNLTLTLLILVSLLLSIGCGINTSLESDVRKVSGEGELDSVFTSLEEIKKEAELTIEGKVFEQETVVQGEIPFTISKVEVLKTYKGKVKKGDIVQVIETGGIYEPLDKEGNKLETVEFLLNNVSTLKVEENVFLFLSSFSGPQVEGAYIPLGAYQGKFKVHKDGKIRHEAKDVTLTDFHESEIEEFKDKIK